MVQKWNALSRKDAGPKKKKKKQETREGLV